MIVCQKCGWRIDGQKLQQEQQQQQNGHPLNHKQQQQQTLTEQRNPPLVELENRKAIFITEQTDNALRNLSQKMRNSEIGTDYQTFDELLIKCIAAFTSKNKSKLDRFNF